MKTHLSLKKLVPFFFGLILFCFGQPSEARPRLTVLPFKNPGGFGESCPLGSGLAEVVRKRLMDTGKVQIVSREDLGEMKNELNKAQDDYFDPSTFPEKGGFQGADYLLTGKVLDFGHFSRDTGIGTLGKISGGFEHTKTIAYVRIAIEVTDLKNGKLILSENYEGREQQKGATIIAGDLKGVSDDISNIKGGIIRIGTTEFNNSMLGKATNKSIDQIIPRLAALFKLEAKVLAISPEGIVLDIGSTSGIRQGTKGKLFNLKEIKNAQGRIVWQSKKQVGEVTIAEVQPDGSLARSASPVEAREGDLVLFDVP